jgi:hypothetical protein
MEAVIFLLIPVDRRQGRISVAYLRATELMVTRNSNPSLKPQLVFLSLRHSDSREQFPFNK